MDDESQLVAAYGAGTYRPHELQAALEQTWSDLLGDPERQAEIAAMFGIKASQVESLTEPPLTFRVPPSGMSGGEIAVLVVTWGATEVLLGAVRDMAKETLKARLKELWKNIMVPALRKHLPGRESLGSEKDLDERD